MKTIGLLRRLVTAVAGAVLLTLGGAAGGAVPVAQAGGGLGVYVGYADDVRANPTSFPTPWSGASNTIFIGSGSPWDAGAIRLVNSGTTPMLVNDVSVDLHHGSGGSSGPTFDLWGSFTIPAGSQAILTQTAQYNFDSSDFPFEPCGTPAPAGDPRVPTVTVTVNGSPSTFTDSGHVLDTGGFDSACLGNESIQWTAIGSSGCAGSTLSLAPPAQSRAVGTPATVTATFTNSCGQPLSNVTVDFSVTSGPNSGAGGSGTTNSQGKASFTYTSAQQGTDTVQAHVTNPAGTITSNSVDVTWKAAGGGTCNVSEALKDLKQGKVLEAFSDLGSSRGALEDLRAGNPRAALEDCGRPSRSQECNLAQAAGDLAHGNLVAALQDVGYSRSALEDLREGHVKGALEDCHEKVGTVAGGTS